MSDREIFATKLHELASVLSLEGAIDSESLLIERKFAAG